jgi:hypothetical protein
MDCPAEEMLIRCKQEQLQGLEFNLLNRTSNAGQHVERP